MCPHLLPHLFGRRWREKRQRKTKGSVVAFQVSVPAAAIWRCLRSDLRWWERMMMERRWMVWGKVERGKLAGEGK